MELLQEQNRIFHTIASKKLYVNRRRNMKKQAPLRLLRICIHNQTVFDGREYGFLILFGLDLLQQGLPLVGRLPADHPFQKPIQHFPHLRARCNPRCDHIPTVHS